MTHNSHRQLLISTLYVVVLLSVAVYCYKRPAYNWDMLGYMALVISIDNPDPGYVHTKTYTEAKAQLPAEAYRLLTDTANKFRVVASTDPLSFRATLPYYAVKPLYLVVCYLLYKLGVSLVAATLLPSVLAFFLIGALFFYWVSKYVDALYALVVSVCLICTAPLIGLAKLSTPDSLASLWMLIAVYCVLERRNIIASFVFLLLAVYTRIDHVITCFVITSMLTFSNALGKKIALKRYLLFILIIGISYFLVSYGAHLYGWDLLFVNSFYAQKSSFLNFTGISLTQWLSDLKSGLLTGMMFSHLFIVLLLASLVMLSAHSKLDTVLCLAILVSMAIRTLLHAQVIDRFFAGYYLVIIILLVRNIAKLLPVNMGKTP